MDSGGTGPRVKFDYFMPLFIGPFLQDTIHLSRADLGSYLLLLLRYWSHGPLPNDPEELAITARVPPDAWSKAHAALSMFFSVGSDGLLHQHGADKRIVEWKEKRLRAHEKAVKAARARWDKEKAKRGEVKTKTASAPSIAPAMPYNAVQVQKQVQVPTPTPPVRREGMDAPSMAAAEVPPAQASLVDPQASGHGAAARSAAGGGVGEHIGKPLKKPVLAVSAGAEGGKGHGDPNAKVEWPLKSVAPGTGNGSNHAKPDARFEPLKNEVLAYWRGQNPGHPGYAWRLADGRALHDLLAGDPEMSLEHFRQLLHNRAASEVNPSALPYKWLRSIEEYAAGPLTKYAKPLAASRGL